jgi:hypothetical protein
MSYPQAMVHPGYQPAVIERPSPGKPLMPGEEPQSAKAAVFPPVTVMNEDQEGQHRALGYTLVDEPEVHHGFQEYPKWVGDRIVNSAAEEASLKKANT